MANVTFTRSLEPVAADGEAGTASRVEVGVCAPAGRTWGHPQEQGRAAANPWRSSRRRAVGFMVEEASGLGAVAGMPTPDQAPGEGFEQQVDEDPGQHQEQQRGKHLGRFGSKTGLEYA